NALRASRRTHEFFIGPSHFDRLTPESHMMLSMKTSVTSSTSTTLITDEKYRLMVESIADYAIFMLDPSGVVTSWNAGAERITGCRAEDVIGHHVDGFYTEQDRDSGAPNFELEIADKEGRYKCEGQRVRADGTCYVAEVLIGAVRDAQGRLLGFTKTVRD